VAAESDESVTESGSEFRQKFEQTQAEAAGLRAVIADQFGVAVEDLKGVAPDQIAVKASEIKAAQQAAEDALLRKRLGLAEGDDLDAALAKLRGGDEPAAKSEPVSNPFTSTGALGGTPPAGRVEQGMVHGVDRIAVALENVK
jgi:hypothetical protein